MRDHAIFDKIDLHLIRVLHTVLTERSVSRAAIRLGMHQPAVSASLKRLRDFAGDPLLVRSGSTMVPTDAALRMIEPSASILRAAEMLFSDARGFEPAQARNTFRVAASDYLDTLFLPRLVTQIKTQAPHCNIDIQPLSADSDYQAHLSQGEVDIVIGNWSTPPDDLHLGTLFDDEVVCLVSKDHPAVRRGWDQAAWLEADHVAPGATHPGAKGIIDEHPVFAWTDPQHHHPLRALRPDPLHGRVHAAGADHRAQVLRAVSHAGASGHPAVPDSLSTPDLLPALA